MAKQLKGKTKEPSKKEKIKNEKRLKEFNKFYEQNKIYFSAVGIALLLFALLMIIVPAMRGGSK